MTRKFTRKTVFTDKLHDAVQKEIEDYLKTNFYEFRKELLSNMSNDELAHKADRVRSVSFAMKWIQASGHSRPKPEYWQELYPAKAFALSWVRDALTPTISDHLNEIFCGKRTAGFWGSDEDVDRIYFSGAPETVHWFVRTRAPEKDPEHRRKFPEIIRELVPELFDPYAADFRFLGYFR